MRAALIFVCGLGAFSAVSATIEESQLGIRQSRSPAGFVGTESVAQDLGLETRSTSSSGLDETVATNCPKVVSDSGDDAVTVEPGGATR